MQNYASSVLTSASNADRLNVERLSKVRESKQPQDCSET